jgi:hypothetical protein
MWRAATLAALALVFVNVSQLAWPHMLVEIDVTAMVAAR